MRGPLTLFCYQGKNRSALATVMGGLDTLVWEPILRLLRSAAPGWVPTYTLAEIRRLARNRRRVRAAIAAISCESPAASTLPIQMPSQKQASA
jgi:hypothetical protein